MEAQSNVSLHAVLKTRTSRRPLFCITGLSFRYRPARGGISGSGASLSDVEVLELPPIAAGELFQEGSESIPSQAELPYSAHCLVRQDREVDMLHTLPARGASKCCGNHGTGCHILHNLGDNFARANPECGPRTLRSDIRRVGSAPSKPGTSESHIPDGLP